MTFTTSQGNRIKIEKGKLTPSAPKEEELLKEYFPNLKLKEDENKRNHWVQVKR